jgi:beta-lactam-binding protein with PASTA domain
VIGYFRFAFIVILLAGIVCVSAIITMQFSVHGTIVQIPDLRGLSVDEATSRIAALGLDLTVAQRFYSTVLPAGSVLLQSPAAETRVRRGWNVAVAESLGPQKIAVPNVLGESEHAAILTIREKGLELGSLATMPDMEAAPGTVLAQDPAPDARGAEQPSVSLLLSSSVPPPDSGFFMPDELGRNYNEASSALNSAGIKVQSTSALPPGATISLSSATVTGTIVWQQPPAGARIDEHTIVTLSVAGGSAGPAAPPSTKPR